ncbi:YopX family protein [Sporosarcina saromensis]|uniref:YopX family protein n=1 Tax=Sporosarcina saromensis TaxID=359365 RepID=A0ABU4GBV6_9BACL|nr:YopX family protein [Sporosarcina saromensis]MDW0113798.1 YopX family protein [Sporosarcina saromensis]
MSRAIKFRGKCLITGVWKYGDLLQDRGKSAIVTDARIYGENGAPWVKRIFEVESETVGQFINVTDELGAEVFEGDVLAHEDGEWSFIARVTHGGYEWFLEAISPTDTFSFGDFYDDGCVDMKIVGNIYENPEMLEVAQ